MPANTPAQDPRTKQGPVLNEAIARVCAITRALEGMR